MAHNSQGCFTEQTRLYIKLSKLSQQPKSLVACSEYRDFKCDPEKPANPSRDSRAVQSVVAYQSGGNKVYKREETHVKQNAEWQLHPGLPLC